MLVREGNMSSLVLENLGWSWEPTKYRKFGVTEELGEFGKLWNRGEPRLLRRSPLMSVTSPSEIHGSPHSSTGFQDSYSFKGSQCSLFRIYTFFPPPRFRLRPSLPQTLPTLMLPTLYPSHVTN